MANTNVASFPFAPPTDVVLTVASDNAQTVLVGEIDAEISSIALADASKFAVPCLIVIDGEVIRAGDKATDTLLSCERGFGGTSAATHADGATVCGDILAHHHNQVAAEIKSVGSYLFTSDLTGFKRNENLLTYSEAFDNDAYWSPSSGVMVGNSVALLPNGTSARLITEGSSLGANKISATPTGLTPGQIYTFSVYAKYTNSQWLLIGQHIEGTEGNRAWFDIQNGVVGTVGTGATPIIVPVGGGWYRCVVVVTSTSDPNTAFDIAIADADASVTYLGTATNTVIVAAAQVRSGSLDGPLTYIRTSGTSFSLTGSGDLILDEGDLS